MSTLNKVELTNTNGMSVTLCDFGARILSIKFPLSDGTLVETTENLESDEDILNDCAYMGATCGRVANRISSAGFTLNGQRYNLDENETNKTLHGGSVGLGKRIWHVSPVIAEDTYQEVTFHIRSADGDQGFPGNMDVSCIYKLDDDNTLTQRFVATTDKDCPINLCDHTYFNLGAKHLNELSLQVLADEYIPVDENSIPLGHFAPVDEIMDFREERPFANVLSIKDYDECYRVAKPGSLVAVLKHLNTGLRLDISSDQPGIQVYTGNYLPTKHSAVALEAEGFPDAINQAAFDADIVTPAQPYHRYVKYSFSIN
ncbi:aldose epimerase family protein [Agaribacter flavus]|uniref:Aldose epimerase family protein n=1 Tax=Agaribacter flavus TaxID=1902781 RepID=A0ABV7FXB3_9ALTE